MEERIIKLEQEIENIKKRNIAVEGEKAWETSNTRAFVIALVTYVFVLIYFLLNDISQPFSNAFVAMCGFILSIQTIPIIKRAWIKNRKK